MAVACQVDHVSRQLWGKVILSRAHLICHILNYYDRLEYHYRGIEHFHTPIHMFDATKLDKKMIKSQLPSFKNTLLSLYQRIKMLHELHELVKNWRMCVSMYICMYVCISLFSAN